MYITYCLHEHLEHISKNGWPWHRFPYPEIQDLQSRLLQYPHQVNRQELAHLKRERRQISSPERPERLHIIDHIDFLALRISGRNPTMYQSLSEVGGDNDVYTPRQHLLQCLALTPQSFLYFFLSLLHESVGKLTIDQKERKRKLRY